MEINNVLSLLKKNEKKPKFKSNIGFRVHFEIRERSVLISGYFPESHEEKFIKTEEEAWNLAKRFSIVDENYVNIYVVDHKNRPVLNYNEKRIRKY